MVLMACLSALVVDVSGSGGVGGGVGVGVGGDSDGNGDGGIGGDSIGGVVWYWACWCW